MPISGERPKKAGNGYLNDPISAYAKSFTSLASNILNESGFDLFSEPSKVFLSEATNETMKNFFIEGSCDEKSMSIEELADHKLMMENLYLNDVEAIMEFANIGSFNPVIGMTIPMHKNIMMNNIFDKGAIQKAVAATPKFTITMETRTLIDVNGNEIDMVKQQHLIKDAMEATAPLKTVDLTLPEIGATDIVNAIGGSSKDSLSIETWISHVKVAVQLSTDAFADVWIPVALRFTPGYGSFERTLTESISVNDPTNKTAASVMRPDIKDTIFATMQKDRFNIQCLGAKVKAVRLTTRKDTANGLSATCQVKWSAKTDLVEIPTAIPINTPISPEEVKDISALYQVNQLSKVMAMFKDVMENHKDDKIRDELNMSFERLTNDQKISAAFDMAPTSNYALDPVSWREKMFFDALDTHVTNLLRFLNDPNMSVTIFGRPDIIRKIQPTEYTYKSPDAVGVVELEFERTVFTSNKRIYNFMSTQKMDKVSLTRLSGETDPQLAARTEKERNSLVIVLNPKNSERIVYRIYDYQMYVSNDIRNVSLNTLPSVHAFERWKFLSYQPVQGRIEVKNPTGMAAI